MLALLESLLCCLQPVARASHPSVKQRKVHVPPQVHTTLANPKERVIVIGDVHGCLDEMLELLKACNYSEDRDTVILVGDLVNKGPKSPGVVATARAKGFFAVRGNHDDSCLFAREKRERERAEGRTPQADDKYAYTDELSAEDVQYLRSLPYTISLPSLQALVVHAGLVPGVDLEAQDLAGMYTMRNLVKSLLSYQWSDRPKEGVPWAGEWRGRPHVYFGHDAKRGLQQYAHATGLDTGCCYGRSLSAMVLPERRLVQVAAKQMYSKPGG